MTEKIFDGKDYSLSQDGTLKKRETLSVTKALSDSVGAKSYSNLDDAIEDVRQDLRKFDERKL